MQGITRGVSTLAGAAVAGFLVWLSTQLGTDANGGYWAAHGLLAAAGLTMALSQIVGGWTKWGWPQLSGGVFALGFLPVLLAGGWVLLSRMPADWGNTSAWSEDVGMLGLMRDLGGVLPAISFGIGLAFGLTFDTAGRNDAPAAEPVARAAADEPLSAEREHVGLERGAPV